MNSASDENNQRDIYEQMLDQLKRLDERVESIPDYSKFRLRLERGTQLSWGLLIVATVIMHLSILFAVVMIAP